MKLLSKNVGLQEIIFFGLESETCTFSFTL